jgi:hypothetical protein
MDFQKLHVRFKDGVNDRNSRIPRTYTLTHSDTTGDLFLTIGHDYEYKQISNLYTRLMRDEILGEWKNDKKPCLTIHCHCSGGIVLGTAKWRASIFRYYMPTVLEAICYGDKSFLIENQELHKASIYVHFHSKQKSFELIEEWGIIEQYMPI